MTRPRGDGGGDAWDRLRAQADREPRRLPALLRAAHDGDLVALRRLLADGVPVDSKTEDDPGSMFFEGGETALMAAAASDELAAAELLLDAGAAIDAVAQDGNTALTRAASAGSLSVVRTLLDRGAKLRPEGALFTPLHGAAERGDTRLVELLMQRGAPVDEPIWTGSTPLMAAADHGHAALVRTFIDAGANVDRQDDAGNTAFHAVAATKLDDLEGFMRHDPALLERLRTTAAALVAGGASPDLKNREGETPLWIVCGRYDDLLDLARLLLAAGAPVQRGLLVRAASMHATLVAACLIDAGANVDERDDDGRTALLVAAENGYADLVQLLVECGATGIEAARAGARAHDRNEIEPLFAASASRVIGLPASSAHTVSQAQRDFSDGKFARARASYEWLPRALRERIPGVLSNIAYCYQNEGKQGEALRCFELALARDPSAAHMWRAACYSAWGCQRWDDMRKFAEGATTASPRDDYAWQQLAIANAQLGDHAAAIPAGRKAIELNPRNAFAACNLACAMRELKDPDWVPMLERALALDASLEGHVAELLVDPAFASRAKARKRGPIAIPKPPTRPRPKPRAKSPAKPKPKPKRAPSAKTTTKTKTKTKSKPIAKPKPIAKAKPSRRPKPKPKPQLRRSTKKKTPRSKPKRR